MILKKALVNERISNLHAISASQDFTRFHTPFRHFSGTGPTLRCQLFLRVDKLLNTGQTPDEGTKI
jgi:hypothetical protein